ncbi:MAG TPA: DUF2203 domain-containing protein [Candidatus Limnocylindrales bacterium]|jgi:hypothetical protein|nr:DUF2203 domain-containing protein [Candidatus Limnocylindrales bacterium]
MADDEQRIFTLTEAERTRAELEPLLLEAMEERRRMSELDEKLGELATRIQMMGGMRFDYDEAAKQRLERNRHEKSVETAVEHISATGCVVKDLDAGLLDFPARLNDEDVYFCWRVGEDRIRFYHRQDEGFAGRKPIDPRDADYHNPIQ